MLETITVESVEEVWRSPDNQRILNEVTTDKGKFKTYSGPISSTQPGESIEVDIEERNAKNGRGKEMFVTLPKRDDWVPSPNGSRGQSRGPAGQGTPRSMVLSFAKDLFVAGIEAGDLKFGDFSPDDMFGLADNMAKWCDGNYKSDDLPI